jgi:hypothetical protein
MVLFASLEQEFIYHRIDFLGEILISGRGVRREDWPSSALWARPPGKLLDLTGTFFFDSNHFSLGRWRWTVS